MHRDSQRAFNRLLFEAGAVPYDLLTRHPLWREHCRQMLVHVPRNGDTPRRILDLGCGPGVSAIEMLRAEPTAQVVGLDLAGQMLARARRHRRRAGLTERLPLLQGDVAALPFRDGCADGVTGHSFLYLVPDKERALGEMKRVLRPGGALVLLEPAGGRRASTVASFARTPTFALTMSLWRLASGAAGRYSPESLSRAFEDAGFQAVTAEPTLLGLGIIGRGVKP